MRLPLLLLLLLPFVVSVTSSNYNYADLALKWCPHQNSPGWSIHGWWPEYNTVKWPSWCDKSRYNLFNNSAIESIRPIMVQEWGICPTWTHTSDFYFWKHEWEKHGTCTNDTVLEYFTHSLKAYFQAEAENWYGCCDKSIHPLDMIPTKGYLQCLIPFSKNETEIKWLGYCHSVKAVFYD
jgi:hypothetical protein